jgi:hypothetical protein
MKRTCKGRRPQNIKCRISQQPLIGSYSNFKFKSPPYLGISGQLKIWQVSACKIGPQHFIIATLCRNLKFSLAENLANLFLKNRATTWHYFPTKPIIGSYSNSKIKHRLLILLFFEILLNEDDHQWKTTSTY